MSCPICGRCDEVVWTGKRFGFGVCHKHKLRWRVEQEIETVADPVNQMGAFEMLAGYGMVRR